MASLPKKPNTAHKAKKLSISALAFVAAAALPTLARANAPRTQAQEPEKVNRAKLIALPTPKKDIPSKPVSELPNYRKPAKFAEQTEQTAASASVAGTTQQPTINTNAKPQVPAQPVTVYTQGPGGDLVEVQVNAAPGAGTEHTHTQNPAAVKSKATYTVE